MCASIHDIGGLVHRVIEGVVIVLAGEFEPATFKPGAHVALSPEIPRDDLSRPL